MCSRQSASSSSSPSSSSTTTAAAVAMTNLTVETDDSFSSPLELAANNDVEGFKRSIECDPAAIDEIGLWYGRKKHSNQMVLEHRTPLMVAATYGSLDVLKFIVSVSDADVNRGCGPDNTTALHCAASGGSVNAPEAVNILVLAGADTNAIDSNGLRACDVIVVSPKLVEGRCVLENLVGFAAGGNRHHGGDGDFRVSTTANGSNSPPLSPDEGGSPSDSTASAVNGRFQGFPHPSAPEKKEYPVDPSLPDIKNSIYATDEFRMFSFKVRPCSRAYSHDWTECPFVHPGENARRRDPRKFHYSCVPCPDFRKGACRRGDLCEYAHGVFECWLHPAQYRTRLCKDGTSCNRRVCFFAHTAEELRPLFVSTGSAVPSPRSTAAAGMEMALNMLPCSPSSVSMMTPTPFTSPMSPSANGMPSSSMAWPQPPNVPTLHLTAGNLQSSRLRSSVNARDITADELCMLQEMESNKLLGELSCLSSKPGRLGSLSGSSGCNGRSKALTPSNLDELFCAEMASSPRYNTEQGAVFSSSHKSAVFNQLQQQQSLLSPINTAVFSPTSMESPQLPNNHSPLVHASLGISTPGRMSPRGVEPHSPFSSSRLSVLAQREQQQQQLRSLSSRELGSGVSAMVGSPGNSSLSKWGSPSGKVDWGFNNGEEPSRMRRSNSFELVNNGEEPDLSWVQSLVKEPSPEVKDKSAAGGSNSQGEEHTVIGGWLEQMHMEQRLAAK